MFLSIVDHATSCQARAMKAYSGNVKTLEGKPLDTTLIALLQFPSAEAAAESRMPACGKVRCGRLPLPAATGASRPPATVTATTLLVDFREGAVLSSIGFASNVAPWSRETHFGEIARLGRRLSSAGAVERRSALSIVRKICR
jgi:hypothetical protein